ncbi:hypothetical protein B0T17DRAFT_598067 [Bombardia bombarda]|uniref:Uncharacterized protein n=1 Tax=Bombardia bombarda TaxID=252184 RepID=A0AA39XAN0_9PEZI|nr:hypothetical protein B0T17DRAFT_598067 [Bombardia bombarda]
MSVGSLHMAEAATQKRRAGNKKPKPPASWVWIWTRVYLCLLFLLWDSENHRTGIDLRATPGHLGGGGGGSSAMGERGKGTTSQGTAELLAAGATQTSHSAPVPPALSAFPGEVRSGSSGLSVIRFRTRTGQKTGEPDFGGLPTCRNCMPSPSLSPSLSLSLSLVAIAIVCCCCYCCCYYNLPQRSL